MPLSQFNSESLEEYKISENLRNDTYNLLEFITNYIETRETNENLLYSFLIL